MKVKCTIEFEVSFKSFKDKKLNDLTLEEVTEKIKHLTHFDDEMYGDEANNYLEDKRLDDPKFKHPDFKQARALVPIKVKSLGKIRVKVLEK